MQSFRHIVPSMRIHYGADSLDRVRSELEREGLSRAVVVCGRTLAADPDGLGRLVDGLGPCFAGAFDGVAGQSPVHSVVEVAEMLSRKRADCVIALGGGSAIVTARAASIMLAEARPLGELHTRFEDSGLPFSPRLVRPKLPQFVIPTTPTTACAKAGAAVFDHDQGKRLTMFDPKTRARALFLDPELAFKAPLELVRDAALHAFSTAVQGLESATVEPLAEASLIQALRLFRDGLPRLGGGGDGAETRGRLLLAAILAGEGSDHTGGGGVVAAISHCLGIRLDVPHGLANAILLPHAIRFNSRATGNRLAGLVELMTRRERSDADVAGSAADACAAFFASLGLPERLRDVGVTPSVFEAVASDTASDWFRHQNPRRIHDDGEVISLLKAAF